VPLGVQDPKSRELVRSFFELYDPVRCASREHVHQNCICFFFVFGCPLDSAIVPFVTSCLHCSPRFSLLLFSLNLTPSSRVGTVSDIQAMYVLQQAWTIPKSGRLRPRRYDIF
jgi:hypothetical protein